MAKKKTYAEILAEMNPNGDFSEQDLWDAIAEANDLDFDPSDGDLIDWL